MAVITNKLAESVLMSTEGVYILKAECKQVSYGRLESYSLINAALRVHLILREGYLWYT